MSDSDPIRLLILEESQNRAEELIVLLRNAGRATRAHLIESSADFSEKITESSWDLVLAASEVDDFTAEALISQLQTADKDIPVILLADSQDPAVITDGLKMGAVDVALQDDEERLVLIIMREMKNLHHRRMRRRAEVELKETDRRNNLLLDSSTTAIAYVTDGMHIYTNQAYVELFGYEDEDEYAGIPIIDLIAPDDQGKFKDYLKSYQKDDAAAEEEFMIQASDGDSILTTLTMQPATYEGEPCTQVIFRALIEDAGLEDRIKEISSQDLLTGLFNRQYFVEQLDHIVDAANEGKKSSTLLYIAIDHFPRLRADAGISNADLVIGDLASLLRGALPDDCLVARFGDDTFTVILFNPDKEAAVQLGESLREKVEGHMSDVSGKTFQTTVSIGISIIAENTSTAEEAISRAHQACISSEDGNTVSVYEPAKIKLGEEGSVSADALKDLIAKAVEDNLFKLQFQPVVSLHGDDEEQFEVLIRLQDEDGNILRPGQFMELAEEAGLLGKIDRWVVLNSLQMLAEQRSGGAKTKLFINVTHRSLGDDDFIPWLAVALKAAKLPTDAVVLQVHENDATSYIKQAAKFYKGLQDSHIKSSINHFGCSLNPFNLLKHLTPDFAKLDGSFAVDLDESEDKQAEMAEMVTKLGEAGVLTAISGIEDPDILPSLFMTGINYIQGNYISEPMDDMSYDFSAEDL